MENWNTDMVLLDKARSKKIQINMLLAVEAANNVYELPSTEKAIRYLHAAVVSPPKATLLKTIWAGNFDT